MDFENTFGETRSRRTSTDYGLRHYKGQEIPWQIHDCDGHGCRICKRFKREFIKAARSPAPAASEKEAK